MKESVKLLSMRLVEIRMSFLFPLNVCVGSLNLLTSIFGLSILAFYYGSSKNCI